MGVDAYAAAAKAQWGGTEAYQAFETQTAGKTFDDLRQAGEELMQLLAEFGTLQIKDVSDPQVQQQVQTVQDYINHRAFLSLHRRNSRRTRQAVCRRRRLHKEH